MRTTSLRDVTLLTLAVSGGSLLAGAACSGPSSPSTQAPAPAATTPVTTMDRGNLGVSPSTALLIPGQTEQYVALPKQIFTKLLAAVTWSVDNPAVASVTADGYLVARAPGFTWLRAQGADGTAAHPISVDRDPPVEARGKAKVESCSSESPHACKGAVSSTSFDVTLKYRVIWNSVVAEFWYGNALTTSALVGTVSIPGRFQFFEPAYLAPVVTLGAGGCCSALYQFGVTASQSIVTEGTFLSVSTTTTKRIRIVTP